MNKVIVIVIACVLYSCNPSANEKEVVKIDLSKGFETDKKTRSSNYADNIRYVNLELREECLINRIDHIVYDEYIYLRREKCSSVSIRYFG